MADEKLKTLIKLKERVQEQGTITDLYLDRDHKGNCHFCAIGHLMAIKGLDIKIIESECNGDNVYSLPDSILDNLQQSGFSIEELAKLQEVNDTSHHSERDKKILEWINNKIADIQTEVH